MAHSFDRRRFLALGIALASTGALAACGSRGGGTQQASAVTGPPRTGGSITYLNEKLIDGYQQQKTGSWHVAQVWNQLVERLFYYEADGRFVPHLATGFTENDERTRFTLTIRKGVTFSNGEPLDAAAVAANLNFLARGDEARGIPRSQYFPKDYYGEAVATGSHTVEVRLTKPYGDFIQKLGAWTTVGILAPATINASLDRQSDLRNVYGTGPFVVESWVPNKEVVLARREDYSWPRADARHDGPAYLDKVVVQQVAEPALRVGALESGQVEVIHYVQQTEEQRIADNGFNLIAPSFFGSVWGLQLRLTADYLDDIRVRKALSHGIDRKEILATNFPSGKWSEAKSIFNDVVPGTLDLRDRFAYDPALANSLLDEAGWTARDRQGYRTKAGKRLRFVIYPSVFTTTSTLTLGRKSTTYSAPRYNSVCPF